jgi:hypothetical protein
VPNVRLRTRFAINSTASFNDFIYDRQLLALLPLMRTEGIHQTVKLDTVTSCGNSFNVILDTDFDPLHQVFHPLSMVFAKPNIENTVQINCTFINPHPYDVNFGESATDELCLAGLCLSPSHDELSIAALDGRSF